MYILDRKAGVELRYLGAEALLADRLFTKRRSADHHTQLKRHLRPYTVLVSIKQQRLTVLRVDLPRSDLDGSIRSIDRRVGLTS